MAKMTSHAVYPSLQDKNVFITGGAQGIGAAAVELFTRQGCQVIFLDIDEQGAKETIDRVVDATNGYQGLGRWSPPIKTPVFYQGDVTDLPQLQDIARRVLSEYGTVHVLVNNAAATGRRARMTTENTSLEDWEFSINVNLRHIFFLTQAFLPGMKAAHGGSIVNTGSITWRISAPDTPVYGACKAAIMGLTRTQSKEFGPYNIRVNSVMPGAIATQRQIQEVLTPQYRTEVMQSQSLQRDLTPEDVAKVMVFLASDEASGVTGSSYVVDGGWCSDP